MNLMSEFAKMDIFFVVTTIVVIILGILLALIFYRVWRILGHVERFSLLMSDEAMLVREDIAELRQNVKREGFKMRYIVRFFKGTLSELFGGGKK
jgi:hypothetical protein